LRPARRGDDDGREWPRSLRGGAGGEERAGRERDGATNEGREHRKARVMPWDPRTAIDRHNAKLDLRLACRGTSGQRDAAATDPRVAFAASVPWRTRRLQAGLRTRSLGVGGVSETPPTLLRHRANLPLRGQPRHRTAFPFHPPIALGARRTPAPTILPPFAIIAGLADLPASGTQAFHSHVRLPDERVRLGPHGRRARP
jgi:hypothetical protein